MRVTRVHWAEPGTRSPGGAAERPRVVIVGAGFAGLDCARELAAGPVDVTVVDRNNFHTFQPLLYQVATSALSPSDVAYPVRGVFRRCPNVSFRRGMVEGLDWERREVCLEGGARLRFDYLVVATGATANWFGVPGAEQHALPLYSLADAIRVRNHVLAQFEQAEWERTTGQVTEGRLTFVIVGGGPTGVEMAGALQELFDHVLAKDFPHLDASTTRVLLVEMAEVPLASFSEPAQRHAAAQLRCRGVDLALGAQVGEVTGEEVVLASGERVPARTVIWAAGVRASGLSDRLGVEQTAGGRVVVEPDLSIPGHPDAFAAGDVAAIRGPGAALLPQLAQVAKQSGAFVGRRILGAAGEPARGFRFRDPGTMATIGRGAAVADLPLGVHLTGRLAWLAWLLLHLLFLVGFRNRLSVLVDWVWNFLTYERGPRLIVGEAPPGRG
jgi:NADH dehydrogenase